MFAYLKDPDWLSVSVIGNVSEGNVMRLLTEYMSVPEVNGAVVSNNTLINQKLAPVKGEAETIESRNLQLAKQQEEHKSKLIGALSKFPVTALFLLSKHEQALSKDEQDDETTETSELDGFLSDLQKRFQAASLAFDSNQSHDEVDTIAKQRLKIAVQQFPFAFEDLVSLVDTIIYVYKLRGISFNPSGTISYSNGLVQSKKQYDIILKRLEGADRRGSQRLAEQFKMLAMQGMDEQFLYLTIAEMGALLEEVVLAEHYWLTYRQQLATVNSKLVLFIANQYKGNFLDFEDLVQEGHTGLLKAVDRFKYRLGFQFSTYAGYWIRQAISRALSRSERVVRIPCGQIATINRLFRAKDELTLKTGIEPTVQELAEHTKLSQADVNSILSIAQSSVSLEGFEDEDSDNAYAPIDYLEQTVFTHSQTMIADAQLSGLVKAAIKTLNPREAKILCAHFGLENDRQKTLQEIGAELNLTRERVRQIQVVALGKIKARFGKDLSSFI